MLILRRKKNESLLIGEDIRITIIECASDGVRLAIDAPKQVSILREECLIWILYGSFSRFSSMGDQKRIPKPKTIL